MNRPASRIRLCLLPPGVLLALLMPWLVWAQSVEVLPLKHRLAAELLPVLRSLAGEDGSVQAHENRLIVRAGPQAMADIRRVLAELDTPPRQLLISVRQGLQTQRDYSAGSVGGRVSSGPGEVIVDSGPPGDAELIVRDSRGNVVRGGFTDRQRQLGGTSTQQLRLLEGRPGVIQVGRESPVIVRQVLPSSLGGPVVIEQPVYADASTGFRVVPRIVGEQFELEISPQQTVQDGRYQQVQRLDTTVSGPLGQWVDIGGALTQRSGSSRGFTEYGYSQSSQSGSVMVKVDLLP